MHSGFRFI